MYEKDTGEGATSDESGTTNTPKAIVINQKAQQEAEDEL